MKVQDIMTKNVLFVKENTPIREIAEIMKENDIGSLPVCNKNKEILGIITDRDIVIRGICSKKTVKDIFAKEIMTEKIITVSPFTDLDDAFSIMSDLQVRRLPVVNKKQLIGMLTMGDLSQAVDYSFEISEALFQVCKGCEKSLF